MSVIYGPTEYDELYTDYRHYPFFARRALLLQDVVGMLRTQPLLVAGCGWGYLMVELEQLGFTEVWGLDASPYALERAERVLGGSERLIEGDVLELDTSFPIVVSEDLLPCATNASEAVAMHERMVAASQTLVHILTPGTSGDDRVLWLSGRSWRELLSPTAVVTS